MSDQSTRSPTVIRKQPILLVIQDETLGSSLTALLREAGIPTYAAHGGWEAQKATIPSDIGLALIELEVACQDGYTLFQRLEAEYPGLLCVVLASQAERQEALEALQRGAYDYVLRPLEPSDIIAKVERCYDRARLVQEKKGLEKRLERLARRLIEPHSQRAGTTLEGQLLQSQKLEAIGTLAGGIAHDFNNILSVIMGNAEIAIYNELPADHPAVYSLKRILLAAERARDLVQQILTFSRQREHELKVIRISPIIKESVKLLRASLPSTIDVVLQMETEHDGVLGDPSRIRQILMHLCTNAAHAMRATGGTLEISIRSHRVSGDRTEFPVPALRPGPYLVLGVRDTGCGMSKSIQDRIFEPYFTTRQVGEGTGLGLAVVHGLVKELGGTIQVDSQEDVGSNFCVFLPERAPEAPRLAEGRILHTRASERILFVDDELEMVNIGKRLLEGLGYSVSTRTSSLEALATFRASPNRFHLVITDMTMPFMTGDRLARELLTIRPDIPIILCTGYSELVGEQTAMEIGIREYVMKPLVRSELAETIQRALRTFRSHGEGADDAIGGHPETRQ